jgi:ClpP class serine protease
MVPVFHERSTPLLAVAAHARTTAIEALQFKPSDMIKGGWDGGWTQGENVRSFQRGNVGIIEINGMLWTHDDITAYFLALNTYESIALEYGRMMDNEGIDGVILAINSPGGLVAGCNELAEMIYAGREAFPLGVTAHVVGSAESAAYWLASAASEIVIDSTSILGSIGAILGVYKEPEEDEEGGKEVVFVSSVSPLKAADPESKEGAEEYQNTVNQVGQVFVETVARNRGTDVETVLANFGQGGDRVGAEAVKAGMADRIGSLESVIKDMRSAVGGSQTTEGKQMAITAKDKNTQATGTPTSEPAPAATPAPVASAPAVPAPQVDSDAQVKAERERSAGILAALQGTGLEAKAGEYIAAGASVADVNAAIVAHMKSNPAPAGEDTGTLAAMAKESAPAKQVDGGSSPEAGGDKKQQAEMKAVMDAWAEGAQNVIARGSVRN